jgi:hypothetical protein
MTFTLPTIQTVTEFGETIADPIAYWRATRDFAGTSCCGATATGAGDEEITCRACYRVLDGEEMVRVLREEERVQVALWGE